MACAVSFLVANPIGDNVARLRYAVFPLVLLLAVRRRGRGFASIVAAAALVYAAAPDLVQVGEQADASSSHARSVGARRLVPPHHLPVGARVEVVPTSARWEAYYLPTRGIPLARGWFGRPTWRAIGCSTAGRSHAPHTGRGSSAQPCSSSS